MKYVPLKTGSLEERPMLFDTKKKSEKNQADTCNSREISLQVDTKLCVDD